MRVVAVIVVLVGIGTLGVVGAGSLAQAPPPDPPPSAPQPTGPPGAPPVPPATSTVPATTVPAQPAGPSRAVGLPWHGRLVNGVQLPEVSADWLTWDPVLKQIPNRPERRWGTAKLLRTISTVLAGYHRAHPAALQVLIGDMSRPHGGIFDRRFGGLGHASHQNGLDADIYYPRSDGRLRAAIRPDQIERTLAQDLVNR